MSRASAASRDTGPPCGLAARPARLKLLAVVSPHAHALAHARAQMLRVRATPLEWL